MTSIEVDNISVSFNSPNVEITATDVLLNGVSVNNTASNLGAGEGVFASKVGADLQFKSLVEADNITIASDSNTITISFPVLKKDGVGNITISNATLPNLTTGARNIILQTGSVAHAITAGSDNILLGLGVGVGITMAQRNIIMGFVTANNLTTGDDNVLIGTSVADNLTLGRYNVVIGRNSGNNFTTQNNIVIVGTGSGFPSPSEGSVIIGSGMAGSSDPGSLVMKHRTAAAGTTASWSSNQLIANSSSERFKENVMKCNLDLSRFSELRPVCYCPKKGYGDTNKTCVGLIAEEVEIVYPCFVVYEDILVDLTGDIIQDDPAKIKKEDYEREDVSFEKRPYSLQYENMVALLIAKIQELEVRLKVLEASKI